MDLIVSNIEWILYITGAMTAGMLIGVIAPDAVAKGALGRPTVDAAERLVIRHWTFMVGGAGVLLMLAGCMPEIRTPVIAFALAEKMLIIVMILGNRAKMPGTNPVPLIVADGTMSLLYILYLIGA